jgi:hypothetical protein
MTGLWKRAAVALLLVAGIAPVGWSQFRKTCPTACRPPEEIICQSYQIAECRGPAGSKVCTCVDVHVIIPPGQQE